METILSYAGSILGLLFFVCYGYQLVYMFITAFMNVPKPKNEPKNNRYAVLICARNEEAVLPELIDSIKNQTYPSEYVTIFVMADNCTDNTAGVAKEHGAIVYTRNNTELVGKGYALELMLSNISKEYPNQFDGYFVFDADNVLDEHYIEEMNKTFSDGFEVVTSYRNSKNYGDNWISAGYALWFLHEARHLNKGRMLCKSCCAISGTGFLFSQRMLEENGGWPFHTLTEDIEFTINCVTKGIRIGYCPEAIFFDEQPVTFKQSWKQRLRWSKGYLQVFSKYGTTMISHILKGSFACYDMTMINLPAMILSLAALLFNIFCSLYLLFTSQSLMPILSSLYNLFWGLYGVVFFIGVYTLITEWKRIYATAFQKIKYLFTFPLFMFTFLPISITAFFAKVSWDPINHDRRRSLDDIRKKDK